MKTIEAEALFNQIYVDKTLLLARIRQALQTRAQISLADLVDAFPHRERAWPNWWRT